MKAFFDTNILVDFAYGIPGAIEELDRYDGHAISRIVWIEFLAGARTAKVEGRRQFMVEKFELVELSPAICNEALLLRQRTRLKLANAVVLATARVSNSLLVTRNFRDFPRQDPNVRIPY